jgi:thymidylate synthase ThyX
MRSSTLSTPGDLWKWAAQDAANAAEKMNEAGLHKQVVNRILEPFQHIHVVMTATEWQNFFDLRCHPDAQPEMQALAYAMHHASQASTPQYVANGGWHLPYVSEEGEAPVRRRHADQDVCRQVRSGLVPHT